MKKTCWSDRPRMYDSGVITSNSATRSVDLDLTGRTKLTLEVTDAGDGILNDHADWAGARIVVSPLPPRFTAAALIGTNIVLNGVGGTIARPGGLYYLVSSTNQSAPSSQWTGLATNHFDEGGNFSIGIGMQPGAPRAFYRLKLP